MVSSHCASLNMNEKCHTQWFEAGISLYDGNICITLQVENKWNAGNVMHNPTAQW